MRIAMIGTGWVSAQHLDAILAAPGAELVAVAGRTQAKAESLAAPRRAVAYADWTAMLARERLDAVYICVPPGAAPAIARGCAGRVRGVLVEKPVASALSEAEQTAAAFAAAGTIAAAGYHNRLRAVVGRVGAMCAAQPVVAADAWWHGSMPGPLWWRTRSQSGGQMSEQATHLIDLLRVWMGDAVEVSACAAHGFMTDVPGFTVDDAVACTIRFAGGGIACVNTSCVAPPGPDLEGIGIALRSRGWQARLSGWNLDARIRQGGGPAEDLAGESGAFALQAQRFLAAVAAGDPGLLPCPYSEGVATLRLTTAIDRAAATGVAQRVA